MAFYKSSTQEIIKKEIRHETYLDFIVKFHEIYRCDKTKLIENYGVKTIKRDFIPESNQKIENKEHLFTGAFFLGTNNQPGGF